MLRAFFVIFILCTIAILAVLGFRGQKKAQSRRRKFSLTWCDNRKCAHRRRSIFLLMARSAFASSWHGPRRLRNAESKDRGLAARHGRRRRAGRSAHADRLQCRN